MKPTANYALSGSLLVAAGAIYICLFSFRYDTTITFIAYGFLLLGWALITYKVIGDYFLKIKNRTTLKFIFVVLLLGSIWLFSTLADARVSYILLHHPAKTTIATVLTTTTGRKGNGVAILKYYTETGVIEQEVGNRNLRYRAGRNFLIKYSIEYPEIFRVIKQVDIN